MFTEQVKSAANKTKGLKTVYINHDIPVGTTPWAGGHVQAPTHVRFDLDGRYGGSFTAHEETSGGGAGARWTATVKIRFLVCPRHGLDVEGCTL